MPQALKQASVLDGVEFDLPQRGPRTARRIAQSLRVVRVILKAPTRTSHRLPEVEVTALLAQELNPPAGATPSEWLSLVSR